MNVSGGHLSKEFFELVKAIGESRSKQEEDRIIVSEAMNLKQKLNEVNVTSTKMKEYLVRSLYVEMLGHDASFSYIHAVKLAQDKNLLCKRIGYLACSLCLDSEHELLLLLINTIQKCKKWQQLQDLNSANHLEVAAALSCICKLRNSEMIPAIFPPVVRLLCDHPNELVRRKCCVALHAIYGVEPSLVATEARGAIRRALCDPDPSVMGASLNLIHDLVHQDKEAWIDLVPSLVSILKQITDNRLPRDFDYHRVPAPWIQIKLLALLATLGENDRAASNQISEVLVEVLRRAESGANVSFAIIYEAVKTITTIYPSTRLLELASNAISRFFSSDNHNLKYVGISGLASMVRIHPTFACRPEHQLVVVDCLEDADDTLRRRTLELLFKMTNPLNVEAVVEKLLLHLKRCSNLECRKAAEYMPFCSSRVRAVPALYALATMYLFRLSVDSDFRRNLASKVCRLADRFAPSHIWYVKTVTSVLQLGGGELVNEETPHNLLRLLAEGPAGVEEEDEQFRRDVVNGYIGLLEKTDQLPDTLVKVAVWIIGEYGHLTTLKQYQNLEKILDLLCSCQMRSFEDQLTQVWIFSAIAKLSVLRLLSIVSDPQSDLISDQQSNPKWPEPQLRLTPPVSRILKDLTQSSNVTLQQRSLEFEFLILTPPAGSSFQKADKLLRELYPYDASCEDVEVQENLPFLDAYVSKKSRENGIRVPKTKLNKSSDAIRKPGGEADTISRESPKQPSFLNFTPYAAPAPPFPKGLQSSRLSPMPTTAASDSALEGSFKVEGRRKWGPQGYESSRLQPTTHVEREFKSSQDAAQASRVPTPSFKAVESNRTGEPSWREVSAKALFSGLATENVRREINNVEEKSNPSSVHGSSSVLSEHDNLLELENGMTTFDKIDEAPRYIESSEPEAILNNVTDPIYHEKERACSLNILDDRKSVDLQSNKELYLTPFEASTSEIGSLWPTIPLEKRMSLHVDGSKVDSINVLFNLLKQTLNIHIVEVIGSEGIAACQVENSFNNKANQSKIFIHGSLTGNVANFIIKGEDSRSLKELFHACKIILETDHQNEPPEEERKEKNKKNSDSHNSHILISI